ncbi:MAG: AraC family transcriptional regulator [Chlorobiaceae bacterium]|nr:AraC family transcriptional regulator [Chlorobiaceae bacterium]
MKKLAEKIARLTVNGSLSATALPELSLFRSESPTGPVSYLHGPSICLIAQGEKTVMLGDEVYRYDENHFLITSLGLPVMAQVTRATPAEPYLGMTLRFDLQEISRLLIDDRLLLLQDGDAGRGMVVAEVSQPLLGAFERLLDLLGTPEDIPILSPLVQREIYYRLLVGEQGWRIRRMIDAGSQSYQIARAIDWLKDNFARQFRVEELADYSRMSASSFHHHFRSLTAMSPLQFQKCLRLQEAKRLMLTEHLDAAAAAFRVGYESPSQFSREYSRLFGAPPLRDIRSMQHSAGT